MNAVQEIFTSTVLKLRLFHALEAVINVLFFKSYAKINVQEISGSYATLQDIIKECEELTKTE